MADPAATEEGRGDPSFTVDIDGFEGPLDVLLELARRQKVDLARLSILALADQYLAFVARAGAGRLELAADYLVMAAWLAYLKSRLLLPRAPRDEAPPAAELAVDLARRLRRLEAVRALALHIGERPRLGRDVFPRGEVAPAGEGGPVVWRASLYDLLDAYARQRRRQAGGRVTLGPRSVWSLARARAALEAFAGRTGAWTDLDRFLAASATAADRRTARASAFGAALELAREGHVEIEQGAAFAPLRVRRAPAATV